MIKKTIYILLFSLAGSYSIGQTGGDNVYEFLNLTHSSLVSSLGGTNVSLKTADLNLAYHNPALLNSEMDKSLTIGNFAAGLSYLNYGSFNEADESGNITGTFSAAEYAFSIVYSRDLDSLFSVGANLKPVISHLERYTSVGVALDIGGAYHSRNGLFSAGLVIRNIGVQITTYAGEGREKLPFEIQAGLSQKLAHAPLRFSLTLRHLERFDLTYDYESFGTSVSSSTPEPNSSDFFENALRHMIIGTELIPHKNFYISAGYNYQRRRELQVDSRVSTVGFSWGFGINTSFMSLGFGRATFHLAGTSNDLTLILRPDQLYKKFKN
jgi:hypothetical protein